MKKLFFLLLMLCFGFTVSHASFVRARVANAQYKGSGEAGRFVADVEMSDVPGLVSVKLENDAKRSKEKPTGKILPGGDNEPIAEYGNETINIRLDNPEGSRVILKVYKGIKNLNIYYSGSGNQDRPITLIDSTTQSTVNTKYVGRTIYVSSEYAHLSTVSTLDPGTYYLYSKGFTGGFIGLRFEAADIPQPDSDEQCELSSISDDTTWDFTDVSGTYAENSHTDGFHTYAYFYKEENLAYNSLFAGNCLEYDGKSPLKRNGNGTPFAQDGTLRFNTTVDGVIRVSFSDTGTSLRDDAIKRYLAVNDEKTVYWSSRGDTNGTIPAKLDVTTEYIPVKAGDVYISGVQEDGVTSTSLNVYKIEFFKTDAEGGGNSLVGVTNDTFSQRIYYYENGKSASKWVYGGFKQTTHGLVGGVDDNGILYVSSDIFDDEEGNRIDTNTNGNIMFYAPSGNITSHWLSCSYRSAIYLPVNEGTSGLITITCLQNDYNHKGEQGDRYFELQKEGKTGVIGHLPMRLTSSLRYKPENISTIDGKSYVKLVSHYDETYTSPNEFRYRGEMKVYTITVVMDRSDDVDCDYSFEELEKDYDHEIGPEHTHAVFNWTQGSVSTSGYHYGTLTMSNGAVLTGRNDSAQNATSGTETIHSYRNGDIVKYKNKYYGGLQLLNDPTVYTISAPEGYYITTSTRIHGLYNRNVAGTDDSNLGKDTYISDFGISGFGGGKFAGDDHDDSFMRFPRDDKNARTTTLDFTVTASETIDFKVAGYQLFGVIDAVLVPKKDVPTLPRKIFYDNGTQNLDLTEYTTLRVGGTINYTPQGDEELWWYFVPDGAEYKTRGRWDYINSHPEFEPTTEGVKDQNITKKFSVLNYKFVNATGKYDVQKDNLERDVYDKESNYKPATQSDIRTLAESSASDNVSIDVTAPGTYYYYIHDKNNNYNSVLAKIIFDSTTGIEDVVVGDAYETDDVNEPIYNIYGQRVDSSYRGVVIRNGQKYIQK